MQSIPKPYATNKAAQFHFRTCVLGLNPTHDIATLFRVKLSIIALINSRS